MKTLQIFTAVRSDKISDSRIWKLSPNDIRCAISFKNVGTADATINGKKLNAGDPMLSFEFTWPICDTTSYDIKFAASGTRSIEVDEIIVQKIGTIEIEQTFLQK
jgi:hypothetical protein